MNKNPKILYAIIDGEISGGNIVCLHLIDEALRRGWEVIVTSPSDGPLCEMIRQRNVGVYHLDTPRSYNLGAAIKIAQLIREQRVSLVHTHDSLAGTILACIGGWLAGTPVIVHGHGRYPMNSKRLIRIYQQTLYWWVSRICCSAIIAVSEQVKKELVTQGNPTDKTQVVYNGIATEAWYGIDGRIVRQKLTLPEGSSIVVHVGRLDEAKGQHLLIQAADLIHRDDKHNIFVLLVGEDFTPDAPYRRKLERLARELGVEDIVIFLGQRRDVPELLAAADILVLPSSKEGLPIVILEAMAAGKPVVATPVGGVPEIVSHEETGLLVQVKEVQALANAILRLIQDPQRAREMGQRGYERVRQHFSLEQMLEKTFGVYEEVLNFGGRHAAKSRGTYNA